MIEKTVYAFTSTLGKRALINYSMCADRWLIEVEGRFDDVAVTVLQTSRKTLDNAIACLKGYWPEEEWSEY